MITDAGRIDVLIHNAGHMAFGPAEAFTPEQFASLYDINVVGAQRLNRAALPHMRNGGGEPLMTWVGSTSTRGGIPPYLGPYLIDWGCILAGTHNSMAEALKAVENEVFDLVILDLNLRGKMSSLIAEVLDRRRIPFLFLPSYGN